MKKVNFKSHLLKKSLKRKHITFEELEDMDEFMIDGRGVLFTRKELRNIKNDLEYIFEAIKENASEISIISCPTFLRDYIIKNASTEEIYFAGYEDYFDTLKQQQIDISDEFKKSFADSSTVTEYELFQYIKTSQYLDLKPVITLKDFETIQKYANISDFKIKIENEQEYQSLLEIAGNEKVEVLINKNIIHDVSTKQSKIPQNIDFIIEIKDMSELSEAELNSISSKVNIKSIYIPSTSFTPLEKRDCYSIEEYIILKDKVDEILSQIDNSRPEFDKFMQIYQILANLIEYEYDDDGEPSPREEAHNLKGRIIRRKMCM